MSKKKNERKLRKKQRALRPWCWYCEREFEDEKVLMQHQKAKHFKCHQCPRRLNTAGGLAVHIQQVHKLEVDQLPKIENALPGRDGYEVEIFGMEGIPAPDVADYKRRKEIELGLNPGSIQKPQSKRPRVENRVFTQAELKAQLDAHKALMGANDNLPNSADANSATVYNAEPQAYSAPATVVPPVSMPGMPPFPGFPPVGMPGAPPFPPMPGMPFPPGMPPPPGFPGFPLPGMDGQFGPPPGMPSFAPNGPPPPGMPPFPPQNGAPPGALQMGVMSSHSPSIPLPQPPQAKVEPVLHASPSKPPFTKTPKSPLREYPPSGYVNPPMKTGSVLIWSDANSSPEEFRINSDPQYALQEDQMEQARGTKRARAEDFL